MSKSDSLQFLTATPIYDVLSKVFAELYQIKPQFPVSYLSKWLKNYSQSQKTKQNLLKFSGDKKQKYQDLLKKQKQHIQQLCQKKKKQFEEQANQQTAFIQKIQKTNHLSDLLEDYLPQTIQDYSNKRGAFIQGCYIGALTFKYKPLQENNFDPNSHFDLQNPKIIEYVGASKPHNKFMIRQVLPAQTGRSFQVLKQQEPQLDEEGKPIKSKPKYLYVPSVLKDQKLYFFKYPKLGSFASFPLKVKSCLFTEAFDKGINDFRAYIKVKQQVQKQYAQKLNEARHLAQESKKKVDEHEGNQEDAAFQTEHANLIQQSNKAAQALKQIQKNPPVIQPFKYDTRLFEYVVSVDTLGADKQISQQTLQYIQNKVQFISQKWAFKQYNMLLNDILLFIQDEPTLESLQNNLKQVQKQAIIGSQTQIRQQFTRQKQAQFQLNILKCNKLLKIFNQPQFQASLNVYLKYNLPKYQQIIQIALMLLGHKKDQINISRTNNLNYRNILKKDKISQIITQLEKYQLRRDSSAEVHIEYRINKLLQRLQKIDAEAVSKYNGWLSALLTTVKSYCWTRIQCRDAKKQAYELKLKAKADRQAQIIKYSQQMQKALQVAKAELNEQTLPNFVQEDWRKTYSTQNIRPQPIQVEQLKLFLDIQ